MPKDSRRDTVPQASSVLGVTNKQFNILPVKFLLSALYIYVLNLLGEFAH
jgi:hypothetical protein